MGTIGTSGTVASNATNGSKSSASLIISKAVNLGFLGTIGSAELLERELFLNFLSKLATRNL